MERLYRFEHTWGSRQYHGLLLLEESEMRDLLGEEVVVKEANAQHGALGFTIERSMFSEVHVPDVHYIEWLRYELFAEAQTGVLGGPEPGDSFGFDPREHVM